jgi:hypothetical protein
MRILSLFWQTFFSFFAQQNVASLPKKRQFTLFFVFLKKRSSFFSFSCLQEKRRTFLATIGFFEKRLLFEKETCLKGF